MHIYGRLHGLHTECLHITLQNVFRRPLEMGIRNIARRINYRDWIPVYLLLPRNSFIYCSKGFRVAWNIWLCRTFVLFMLTIVAVLGEESDGAGIVKFLVKYARRAQGYLSYYNTLFNPMVPCWRMIARFSGDFLPNNVIHGLFFMFSWKW